jgi:type VI secretion system secreted protein VgrG
MLKKLFKSKEYRVLTDGEISMLKSLFNDGINYQDVKIYNSGYLPFGMQNSDVAMSPNGHIYFDSKHFIDDFSVANTSTKMWFMHEMTHVWQYNLGYNILLNGFITAISGKYYNSKAYCYDNQCEVLDFNKFSFEQQAEIISHYYGAKFLKVTKYQESLSYYEATLKEFFLNQKNKNLLPKMRLGQLT